MADTTGLAKTATTAKTAKTCTDGSVPGDVGAQTVGALNDWTVEVPGPGGRHSPLAQSFPQSGNEPCTQGEPELPSGLGPRSLASKSRQSRAERLVHTANFTGPALSVARTRAREAGDQRESCLLWLEQQHAQGYAMTTAVCAFTTAHWGIGGRCMFLYSQSSPPDFRLVIQT